MYYMEIDSINIYSKQFLLVIVMDDKSTNHATKQPCYQEENNISYPSARMCVVSEITGLLLHFIKSRE